MEKTQILVVDDELHILRAIKRLLTPYDLELFLTTSSEKALDIISKNAIALVISDQKMPNKSGIEFLLEVKKLSPTTLRILMSGYSDTDVFIKAINNGSIFHYISKPWDNEEMVKAIFNALNTKAEQDERENVLHHLGRDTDQWNDLVNKTKLVRKKDLLNDIINNQIMVNEQVLEEAYSLDIDFTKPYICCTLFYKTLSSIAEKKNAPTNPLIRREILSLLNLLPSCLAWDCEGDIAIFYQLPPSLSEVEVIVNTVTSIHDALADLLSELHILMGVSKINIGPDSLRKCYHQAQNALLVRKTKEETSNNPHIYYFHDLGVLQLLTTINAKKEAEEFIEDYLGKLIQYDQTKDSELLHTLEELLKNHNLKAAAGELFIHPKTLVFRRNRIETILGISLDNYETRLSLGIAIKLYKLHR